jgi:hypothetical protein
MDEMDDILKPSLNATLSEYFGKAQPNPDFAAHLESVLRKRQQSLLSSNHRIRLSTPNLRQPAKRQSAARPFLIVLGVILIILALTGVAYALGRLTGYISGFGFTSENAPVYVLEEPITITKDNITLNIEKAVNDPQGFWVGLSISGLSTWNDFTAAYILLPDGEKILFNSGNSSERLDGKINLNYLFPALDSQQEILNLSIQNIDGKDFNIPLRLRPVEVGELIPVPPEWTRPLKSDNQDGVSLVLDHIAVDSEQTIFQVSLHLDQPNTGIAGPWSVTLSDSSGKFYPLTEVTPDTMTSGDIHIYKTIPFYANEQLLLSLKTFPDNDSLPLLTDIPDGKYKFTFDPGAEPKPGQTWVLNQDLILDGYNLNIVRATLTDEPALEFEVHPDSGVTNVMFTSANAIVTGSRGGTSLQNGNITSVMTLSGIPKEPIEIQLRRIYYNAEGLWQIHWSPPAAPIEPVSIPTSISTPTLEAIHTPTIIISNTIINEAEALEKKFDAYLQEEASWIHIIEETTTIPESGQVFPPPYMKSEEWYEIDSNGFVIRNVHTDCSDTGQIIQQAAMVGDYYVNFATGDSGFTNSPRDRISMAALTDFLTRAKQDGSSNLSREVQPCDGGKTCLVITGWQNFSSPVQNPGETQAYYGGGERVWIDLESGQLMERQAFWILEDGSELASSTTKFTLVERVSIPPQDILDILGRVIVP